MGFTSMFLLNSVTTLLDRVPLKKERPTFPYVFLNIFPVKRHLKQDRIPLKKPLKRIGPPKQRLKHVSLELIITSP